MKMAFVLRAVSCRRCKLQAIAESDCHAQSHDQGLWATAHLIVPMDSRWGRYIGGDPVILEIDPIFPASLRRHDKRAVDYVHLLNENPLNVSLQCRLYLILYSRISRDGLFPVRYFTSMQPTQLGSLGAEYMAPSHSMGGTSLGDARFAIKIPEGKSRAKNKISRITRARNQKEDFAFSTHYHGPAVAGGSSTRLLPISFPSLVGAELG